MGAAGRRTDGHLDTIAGIGSTLGAVFQSGRKDMDDKLQSLISKASERIQAAENERQAKMQREEMQRFNENAERFKQIVETALGSEVMEALGPVTFDELVLEPSMSFQLGGRTFRLKSVAIPPGLAQVEEVTGGGVSYMPQNPQFNLVHEPNAKDIFLDTLGKALRKTPL